MAIDKCIDPYGMIPIHILHGQKRKKQKIMTNYHDIESKMEIFPLITEFFKTIYNSNTV